MGTTGTVLIVEDDEDLRELLAFDFRTSDFEVVACEDGKAAREYLDGTADGELPDVIVLDILMPRVDGMTFLRRRVGSRLESVPVVVLTVLDDEETFREAYELGVDDYVTKPFSSPLLVTRVEHVIQE